MNLRIDLYGLDISTSMLDVATLNLHTVRNVFLRKGNIIKTEYETDFFDCVVITGSLYNWDKPVDGLNEIYRILKTGKTAFIFETTIDYNSK